MTPLERGYILVEESLRPLTSEPEKPGSSIWLLIRPLPLASSEEIQLSISSKVSTLSIYPLRRMSEGSYFLLMHGPMNTT